MKRTMEVKQTMTASIVRGKYSPMRGLSAHKRKKNKPDHEGNPRAPSPTGGLSAHTRKKKKKKKPDHEGCPSVSYGEEKKKKKLLLLV